MYKYLARPYLGVEFLVVLGGLVALGRTNETSEVVTPPSAPFR